MATPNEPMIPIPPAAPFAPGSLPGDERAMAFAGGPEEALPTARDLFAALRINPTQGTRLRGAKTDRRSAFTLLEMVVALSAFVFLIGGIFAIANSTMELTNDLSFTQDRSLVRQNFTEFIRRSFRTLPGEAEVRLAVQQRGSNYVPSLNIANGGTSFIPGGSLPPESSVELFAEERPGGYLRVGLRVLDARQTRALRSGQSVRYTKDQPVIPLLDNVSRFQWRFYDAGTGRWEPNWKDGRRPLLVEMTLQLDDGYDTRAVFWLPPVLPNIMATGAPLQPGAPGDPNNPGVPGAPVVPGPGPGEPVPPSAPPGQP